MPDKQFTGVLETKIITTELRLSGLFNPESKFIIEDTLFLVDSTAIYLIQEVNGVCANKYAVVANKEIIVNCFLVDEQCDDELSNVSYSYTVLDSFSHTQLFISTYLVSLADMTNVDSSGNFEDGLSRDDFPTEETKEVLAISTQKLAIEKANWPSINVLLPNNFTNLKGDK